MATDYSSYKIGGKAITDMTRDQLIGALKAAMDCLRMGPLGTKAP